MTETEASSSEADGSLFLPFHTIIYQKKKKKYKHIILSWNLVKHN